jgi:hypothetical protein
VVSQPADSIKFGFRIQEWPGLKWRVAYFGYYPLLRVPNETAPVPGALEPFAAIVPHALTQSGIGLGEKEFPAANKIPIATNSGCRALA